MIRSRFCLSCFCLATLIIFLFNACKKKTDTGPTGPTYYNIQVTDDYTHQPIAGCKIIKVWFHYPAVYTYDTIATTDANGTYSYQFTDTPYSTAYEYYAYYYLRFFQNGYILSNDRELDQTHTTNTLAVGLNRNATLRVSATRTSSPSADGYVYLNSDYVFSDFGAIVGDSVKYFTVGSNKLVTLHWGHHPLAPFTDVPIQTGYNDTTHFHFNY